MRRQVINNVCVFTTADLWCGTVGILWFFLAVSRVGLQCVVVVFPGHKHSPFDKNVMRNVILRGWFELLILVHL